MSDALEGRGGLQSNTLPEQPAMPAEERYRRVKELFFYASEQPLRTREAWLRRQTGADEEMLREILDLLHSHETAGDFLTSLPQDLPAQSDIGPYRTRRVLGQGGMSTVYLAYRADLAFRKEVAIKVIRQRGELARRFVAERQILASLEHPFIARLIDGGTTEDGYPYLVMEFVAGEPIDAWCDRRRFSVEQRIDLFQKVCSAVTHAHRAGVIHLDLKPSNILVDPNGNPKLLDFGIAELRAWQPSPKTAPIKRPGPPKVIFPGEDEVARPWAMTPDFASPEQRSGAPLSARSDVYSLGVILYHLLTGHPPFLDGLRAATGTDHSTTWVPPSRAIDPSNAADARRAALRASTARVLKRQLRGDLDKILARALHPKPDHRHASVADLMKELRLHRISPRREGDRGLRAWVALAAAFTALLLTVRRWRLPKSWRGKTATKPARGEPTPRRVQGRNS